MKLTIDQYNHLRSNLGSTTTFVYPDIESAIRSALNMPGHSFFRENNFPIKFKEKNVKVVLKIEDEDRIVTYLRFKKMYIANIEVKKLSIYSLDLNNWSCYLERFLAVKQLIEECLIGGYERE